MITTALKIIQHNVRGWKTNKTALTNIYNRLSPHIILINEHGLITNSDTFKIVNYNTHFCNKHNSTHKGAAIAIKKTIPYKLLDDFETDILAIEINTPQGAIVIATAYLPPNADYLHFIDYNKLFNRPEPVYFLGDLNARHVTFRYTNNNIIGKNIITLINMNKCKYIGPHFPTLIRHNSATAPDIALTNTKAFHNLHLEPGPITTSDHIPIIATISTSPIQIKIKPRKQYHKADWESYQQTLRTVQTPNIPTPTLEDIDTNITTWTKHIQHATEKHIPTLKYRIVPGIKPNHTIKTLQIQYDTALNYFRYNGPSLQLSRFINNLKDELQNEYRILQNETWNQIIDKINIEPNTQQFWKSIKRMQGNSQQGVPYIRDHHNNKLHTNTDKETHFREHWQKIFTNNDPIDNNFNYDHIETIETTLQNNIQNITVFDHADQNRLNINFPPITIEELQTSIKSFKQKAPGPTGITALQIKKLPPNMIEYLLHIYNSAISAGYFPDSYKHAIMIFIPKGSTSQYNIKNYRPISLLDTQGKILDKILNTRLYTYLEHNNIINTRQHGFRKNRGTHTALATLCETISNNLTQKFTTDIVLRDVSKAFDKVWHTGLKHKITTLGLHTCFTRTLTDYITDRTASIRIGEHIGPPFPLESGVPQGACLSPTLYSFYTHDIPQPIHYSEYIAFADDITQITNGRYPFKFAAQTTQNAIEQINTYENKWKIQTNTSKFTVIPISRKKHTTTEHQP